MNVIDQLGLRQDPFGPGDGATGFGLAAPFLVARDRLLAAVRRGDPLTVLAGRPGMGKTLLLSLIEQTCRADDVAVSAIARGDMAHGALGKGAQVLLIDEADTINTATMKALAPGALNAAAPTMVFAAARPALHRISSDVRTTIIDLRPLDPEEARDFLLTRAASAGRLDLFTPEALEIIVEAGHGSPRLLRVLAGAAMFQAASDGAAQIAPAHASLAASMHGRLFASPEAEVPLPVAANDAEPPARAVEETPALAPLAARRAPPQRRRRDGALPLAASVALAALLLPVLFQSGPVETPPGGSAAPTSAEALPGPVRLAAAAFTVAPANAAASLSAGDGRFGSNGASFRTASLTTAPALPPLLASARSQPAAASITVSSHVMRIAADNRADVTGPARGVARREIVSGADRALLVDLIAAARVQPAVVGDDSGGGDQGSAMDDMKGATQPTVALAAAVVPPPIIPAASRPAPVPVTTAALETVRAVAAPITETKAAAKAAGEPATVAKEAARATRDVKSVTEPVRAAKQTADQAKTVRDASKQLADVKQAAEQARAARLAAHQASAAKEAASQARAAKEAADQARSAKDAAEQAKVAKTAAAQAKAAKDAASQAVVARAAADQAKAARLAVDQAKSAKDAAEQGKAARAAAGQAKLAKDAADQAKAAKDAVEQSRLAKAAADQAKTARDAADQAKAAKDAAEQAKAAKDAADQAKAAKVAADQAKVARDAADQAKAAKDAADQAKSAKDAADQARAAKDAADQAKAAKDAVDQAKAAKDAAGQAKAAKGAADTAKAARDAARAAKDAAKAAKDAKDAVKDLVKPGS